MHQLAKIFLQVSPLNGQIIIALVLFFTAFFNGEGGPFHNAKPKWELLGLSRSFKFYHVIRILK
ncbi:hypothetical protein EBO34_15540 [Alteribacter keqinensis]|uniref:Uncharacterized protein n=1 Tax=Alteribacter keqinensis TaxID=2483800 RepID=A0A3M7TLZ6_9BACI|nr:hypothetical protein EBO34_15540 [Alteribacter keqinensis]